MSNRRDTLGRRPSIFRRTDTGVPELQDAEASELQDVERSSSEEAQGAEGQNAQTAELLDASQSKRFRKRKGIELEQVTVYLEPSDVEAMTIYQLQHYQKTRQKIERSEIVRQALRAFLSS